MIFLLLHPDGFKEPPPRVYTRRHEQQFRETGKYAGAFYFIALLLYCIIAPFGKFRHNQMSWFKPSKF